MKDPRTIPLFKRLRMDERGYQIQCAILDVLLIAHADAIAKANAPTPAAPTVETRAPRGARKVQ